MRLYNISRIVLFSVLLAVFFASSAGAYSASIRAPAELSGHDAGVLTQITLNVTPGNGTVKIDGPSIVNDSTLMSAQAAAQYASVYVGVNELHYNFTYMIDNASNVSGPSGGLAMTLLAISAFNHKPLYSNFTVTGTISPDGIVGEVGGVYDKSSAAKNAGMRYILVPYAPNSSFEYMLYYLVQQQFGITLVPVANVSQALKYAYGNSTPTQLTYNITTDYYPQSLGEANIICLQCNASAFNSLANFTLNATQSQVSRLGAEYTSLKAQMEALLNQYSLITQRGYLYSGSDLAFLEYIDAYTFANSEGITRQSATNLVDNVSTYCSSLVAPALTNTNYEYVVGGELRQSWGEIYAGYAKAAINQSQSTDGLIIAVSDISKSSGWCRASAEMYSIAVGLGGVPSQTSASFNSNITKSINAVTSTGLNLYSQSAINLYKEGDYAAALYASVYERAFYGLPLNQSMNRSIYSNLSSYNYGAWPTQFALQASFYMQEAGLTANSTTSKEDLQAAYTTANLARLLSSANQYIYASLNYSTPLIGSSQQQASGQLAMLESQIQQLYLVLLLVLILIFIVLIVLLVLVLRRPSAQPVGRRRR